MLGAIESLMSAVVSDRMSGDKHNPNVELVAQGVANIFSPLFGGLPATGAIARTATNIRSGAKTPVAGMVHALTLLAIVLFAAPLARFIPLAVLAAILLVVSYNMGEWREIPEMLKLSKLEIGTWLVTFLADRVRRSDGRCRSRDDTGGAGVHPQGDGDDDGDAGDGGISSRRTRARSAGQGNSGLRGDFPHSRPVSFRRDRQDRRDLRAACTICRRSWCCGCAT